MKTPHLVLWLVLVLLRTALAEPPSGMKEDFEWFTSLGYPDVSGLKFIKYTGVWATTNGEEGMQTWWRFGWLRTESLEAFMVQSLIFESLDFPKEPVNRASGRNYTFAPVDFRAFVDTELHPVNPNHEPGDSPFGPHFSPRTHLFVLGWMCARQGLDELAEQLYLAALTRRRGAGDDAWPFRHRLERDLGEFELWNIMLDFARPQFTRAQSQARLQALPQRFPHCDHLATAQKMATTLEMMVREEAEHKALTLEEIAKLPLAAQVAEWIFRQRDLGVQQVDQPGGINLSFGSARADSTLDRLVALGDAAVPALIAAQSDARLTRSVGYERDFYFSHSVMTVGQLVPQILEQIAGRSFIWQPTMTVEEWWRERQAKGALGQLSAATAAGDRGSPKAGWTLLRDFPEQAAEQIFAGARAAHNPQTLSAFLPLLDRLKVAAPADEILLELFDGNLSFPAKGEIARVLARRGHLEAIQRLAETWRQAALGQLTLEGADRKALRSELSAGFSPECYRALATNLKAQPAEVRSSIVLGARGVLERSDRATPPNAKETQRVSATTLDLVEDLLGSELDDVDDGGTRGTYNLDRHGSLKDPRPCDVAADLLAFYWPEKYFYNSRNSFATRDRQRLGALNVYRAARGLAPMPVPAARSAVPPEERGRISAVEIAENTPTEPAAFLAELRNARGREVDYALYEQLRQALLNASGGNPPPWEHGLRLRLQRDDDGAGVLLSILPGERPTPSARVEVDWQMALSLYVKGSDYLARESRLFSAQGPQDFGGGVKNLWDRLRKLPPDEPFVLQLEFVPQPLRMKSGF